MANKLRLSELLTSLSLAIDLGTGQPLEWVLRSTLLGVQLAQALDLSTDECQEVYYLSLLRHVGCTANAHADAAMFGDELIIAAVDWSVVAASQREALTPAHNFPIMPATSPPEEWLYGERNV